MAWILRLVVVTILLVVAQAVFFRKMGLNGVSCSRRFSSRFSFEGDEIYLLEEISNNRPIPVPLLVVESRIDQNLGLSSAVELEVNQSNYHRSVFSMLPFSNIVRKHKVKLLKRGYYDLRSIAVSAYDLLGFSKIALDEMPVKAIVTVYPRFKDSDALELPSHSFLGDVVVRRWIVDDPFMNAGVRAYQNTDPLKQINWMATARTGSLQVNKHDFTSNTRLLILFNIDTSEYQWSSSCDTELLEDGLSLCATYAKLAVENSIEVGFSSNGQNQHKKGSFSEIPIGSGEEHLYTILEELALLSFSRVTTFHYFLSELIRSGIYQTDILILSAYIDQEILDQADLLRAAGNAVEMLHLKGGSLYGS